MNNSNQLDNLKQFSDYNYALINEEHESNEMSLLQQKETTELDDLIKNEFFNKGISNYADGNLMEFQQPFGATGVNNDGAGSVYDENRDLRLKFTPSSNSPDDILFDEKERRKQRNRDAQKAFRNRKDLKIKELEEKLLLAEQSKQDLAEELDTLKKINTKLILDNQEKAIEMVSHSNNNSNNNNKINPSIFPSKSSFVSSLIGDHNEQVGFDTTTAVKYYTISQTWEYLLALSQTQFINMPYVMDNLRGHEVCHGYGPAYTKEVIDEMVKNSADNI